MIESLGVATALQFKPDGKGGYLYRRDQIGPALPATAAEREAHVRRMGWMVVLGFVLYFAAVVALAAVAQRFVGDRSDTVSALVAVVMGAVSLGGVYLFLRWASHAPARAFAGRPEVAPATTRKAVFGKRFARVTYTRIVLVSAALAAFMVLAMRDQPEAWWLAVGLPAVVGAGYAIWKWRIDNG